MKHALTLLASFQKLRGKLHAALPAARLYVLGLVTSPGKQQNLANRGAL